MGVFFSGEDEEEPHEACGNLNEAQEDTQTEGLQTGVSNNPPPLPSSLQADEEAQNDTKSFRFLFDIRHLANPIHRPYNERSGMGKVAIIRDMGAVTYVLYDPTPSGSLSSFIDHSFEALLYFLYTGEINFAPLSSDSRYELPARTRAGDWSTGRLPSLSSKAIRTTVHRFRPCCGPALCPPPALAGGLEYP